MTHVAEWSHFFTDASKARLLHLCRPVIADRRPELVSASINIFDFRHRLLNTFSHSPSAFSRLGIMVPLLVWYASCACFTSRRRFAVAEYTNARVYQSA